MSEVGILASQYVHARSGAALYHARKFIRRHRAAVSAAIVVMLTLLGAYITTTLELVEARKQREAALASARRTAEALSIFRLSVDALIAEQNVASALYLAGEVREAYEIGKRVYDRLQRLNSTDDYSVLATVNLACDSNRLALSDPAQDMLPAAVARAEREGDLQNFRLGSFELARTRLRRNAPRAEIEAPLDHLEAVRVQKKQPRIPGIQVLIASVRIELDLRDGATHQANVRSRELLQYLADENFKGTRPLYLAHSVASKSALAEGDASRAAEHARLALQIIEPLARGPDTSADAGEALLLLGRALIAQAHPAEAQAVLQRAFRCLSNGYGTDHPATREAERLLATVSTAI